MGGVATVVWRGRGRCENLRDRLVNMDKLYNTCGICGQFPARYRFAKESPQGEVSEIYLCEEHSGIDDAARARMAVVREAMMAYLEEIDAMDAKLSPEQEEEMNRRVREAIAEQGLN